MPKTAPEPLYINKFFSGLYTQRSPLVPPVSSQGLNVVQRLDALSDGLNMELSNSNTLVRRYGYSRFCSVAFGSSEYPLAYYSFKNLSGTIKTLVDTQTNIYTFTSSTKTSILSKGTTAQTDFQSVGNTVYFCNGTDLKKYNGSTVTKWGIATPVTTPTLSFSAGSLSPTSGYRYVYVYKNSTSGHVSTASPTSASTGVQTSKNITVSGSYTTDTQVDKVSIYRTADGGSLFYFVADISNNTAGGTWNYADSTADSALNTLIVAPVNRANDPPPSTGSLVTYHMGRLWMAADNLVYFAGGPDTTNGSPEEAWPPANVFKFPSKVTALASTSNGLVVWTSDNAYIILGNSTQSFYSKRWLSNFGVASQNSVVQDGDLIYVYTTKRQLFEIADSLNEIGFAIGDKLLAGFDPTASYLALHRSGNDSGLFISDGSANIYRYGVNNTAWSTVAQVVSGVGAIASIETSTANWTLLAGRSSGSGYILYRNTASYTDDGSTYTCYAVVGSLVLAVPSTTATLEAVLIERMPVGTDATVSVILNEVSGTFTTLPNPSSESPLLPPTTSIIAKRHYLKAAARPLPQQVRHCQVKVAFGSENYRSELLGLALQPIG